MGWRRARGRKERQNMDVPEPCDSEACEAGPWVGWEARGWRPPGWEKGSCGKREAGPGGPRCEAGGEGGEEGKEGEKGSRRLPRPSPPHPPP